jgi:hypothetical protein
MGIGELEVGILSSEMGITCLEMGIHPLEVGIVEWKRAYQAYFGHPLKITGICFASQTPIFSKKSKFALKT